MSERLYVRLHEDEVAGPESAAPRETLRALPLPPPLRRHVTHLLACREHVPAGVEVIERVLPDGAVRLIVELSNFDDPTERSGGLPCIRVAGATLRPALVRLRGSIEGLALTLAPGATAELLGVPAGELHDRVVPLEALWGAHARELAARLAEARGDDERARVVTSALVERVRSHEERRRASLRPAIGHAARTLASRRGPGALRAVAAELAIGERRLQQLFREHVGLSPREWHRLARLHDCLRLLRAPGKPRWPDVAIAAGYYDQSHLVNEFRALVGLTPGAFLERTISHSSKSAPGVAA